MATTTFNPSYLGRVFRDDDPAVYATTHAAASGTNTTDPPNASLTTCINRHTGTEVIIVRSGLLFDTSSLGAGVTITSATIQFYPTDSGNADSDSVSLVDSEQASTTTIALADYSKIGDAVTNPTKFATDLTISGLTLNAYNTFTLNASGLAAINKTGISKFGLRTAKDCSATDPTGNNYITINGDTGANPPQLIVVYTPAPSGNFFTFFK